MREEFRRASMALGGHVFKSTDGTPPRPPDAKSWKQDDKEGESAEESKHLKPDVVGGGEVGFQADAVVHRLLPRLHHG